MIWIFIIKSRVYIYTYYIYIVIVIFSLFWRSPFIPSRNLDEVFTYNYIAFMSLRNRSHIKASMVFL